VHEINAISETIPEYLSAADDRAPASARIDGAAAQPIRSRAYSVVWHPSDKSGGKHGAFGVRQQCAWRSPYAMAAPVNVLP